MKIIRTKNYDEMSKKAADIVLKKIKTSSFLSLGLATGSTPLGLYKHLIQDYLKSYTSYEYVTTFNLDEYVGLKPHHPDSYHSFMKKHLFHHLDIPTDQTHIPDGIAEDLKSECKRYEKVIQDAGGIDLQILGIGTNGHIGFNEPDTSFHSSTHVVSLADSTRKDNARFFKNPEEVPTHAITVGLKTIFNSKEILLLVSGKNKAPILKQLVEGNINESLPASILKKHNHVTIIADEDALSLLQP